MQNKTKEVSYAEAIWDATDLCLEKDPTVLLMGLGVSDPKGVFGTTLNLHKKYGADRVFDVPVSENCLTGVVLGAATMGMRPILTHQRMDFVLLSFDQIINNLAKWHYMFSGQLKAPVTIRMIIGRGWGQGPQHSQSLQALLAHIPGLKVVMPTTPQDAKGLLISSIEDDNPVMFLEHRWLHGTKGPVPTGVYRTPIGKVNVIRSGSDLTIVGLSYMVLEAFRAAEVLAKAGIDIEVIDLRTIKPLDGVSILNSVKKTGRLIVADTGHLSYGVGAEIVACTTEHGMKYFKSPPKRISSPDMPTPSSSALSKTYYPRSHQIAQAVFELLEIPHESPKYKVITELQTIENQTPSDVPDLKFTGPF